MDRDNRSFDKTDMEKYKENLSQHLLTICTDSGLLKGTLLSSPDIDEAKMKETAIEKSYMAFVMADHTKFGRVYMARLNRRCDYVITDTRIRDYDYQWLMDSCTVLFADETDKRE